MITCALMDFPRKSAGLCSLFIGQFTARKSHRVPTSASGCRLKLPPSRSMWVTYVQIQHENDDAAASSQSCRRASFYLRPRIGPSQEKITKTILISWHLPHVATSPLVSRKAPPACFFAPPQYQCHVSLPKSCCRALYHYRLGSEVRVVH